MTPAAAARGRGAMSHIEQLRGLDAAFLYLETPTQHMHVTGTMILEPRLECSLEHSSERGKKANATSSPPPTDSPRFCSRDSRRFRSFEDVSSTRRSALPIL